MPPATRFGCYEITGTLGAGGMGEVYRARDTKLQRDVALKVLPEEFARDADRVARFAREAQLLAALNHPNIATIHGFETVTASAPSATGETAYEAHALVLELIEGSTLADRLAAGPLPLEEALSIAKQIADALEAAHERGIVHRDLKPSNVKVRPDGTVKVLDLGLAKALEPGASANVSASQSPTLVSPAMTHLGVALGTAAYMAPEQARGNSVDERADVWAYGCVLFEMLSGARPFPGEDATDTIASVLRSEPEWSELPADTPALVRRLLGRCLQKDRRRRLADIRDARLDVEEALDAPRQAEPAARRSAATRERLLWLGALLLTATAAALLARDRGAPGTVPAELRVDITTPPTTDPISIAISPDARHVAYVANADVGPQLWVRSLESGVARPLRGGEGASFPFWSPDSRSLGFFANERLYRVAIDGGSLQVITTAPVATGGTWSRDGLIAFTPVPDAPVTGLSLERREQILAPRAEVGAEGGERFPQFLPDSRHFLYYVAESRGVFLGSLDGPERRRLLDADAGAVFAPPDEVLFVRDGRLLAQRFDTGRLELAGETQVLAEGIAVGSRGAAALSASATGAVLYRTGSGSQIRQLAWFDRSGREVAAVGAPDPGIPMNPQLSPDGRRVALSRAVDGNTDIWLIDLNRDVQSRFTFDPLPEIYPIWAQDGSRILFSKPARVGGTASFAVHQRAIAESASDTLLFQPLQPATIALDWSNDGRFVAFRSGDVGTDIDLWAQPLANGEPIAVSRTRFNERTAQFSPDSKWIAYESDESGRFEIYVQSFPQAGAKLQLSTDGGSQIRWRPDGTELFYVAADGWLTAVPVRLPAEGMDIELGAPAPLFRARVESTVQGGISHTYAVAAGGERFLMSTFTEQDAPPLTLILNRPRSR